MCYLILPTIDSSIKRDQVKMAEHFVNYFSSVVSDAGDSRVLAMSEYNSPQ